MRIAVQVFGARAGTRHEEIRRFTHGFVKALLDLDSGHEFLLYAGDDAPPGDLPGSGRAEVRRLTPKPNHGDRTVTGALQRLLGANADGVDILLLTDPVGPCSDPFPPIPPLNGVKLASLVYDLSPLLSLDQATADPPEPSLMRPYHRGLERLKRYDGLLAVSEPTRGDLCKYLGMSSERVTNIRAAVDGSFFTPAPPGRPQGGLERLGVNGPFVYGSCGVGCRKDVGGLIEAFAGLPKGLRSNLQLVLTCAPDPEEAERVRSHALRLGTLESLVITGRVDDETLRSLYRACEAFVFPSRHEGLGLPVLEAMCCGAPVIAGDNSSQNELVGGAGLLADSGSADDIRAKLHAVLASPTFAADLRLRAPGQAARFPWRTTAELGMGALEAILRRKTVRVDRRRPRIAYFSPFAPLLSGISDYSARLIEVLKAHYKIDVYHDSGYVPELRHNSSEFACYDHRLFPRISALRGYHAVLYQMGNWKYHHYIYLMLQCHPGLVTLHDFNLAPLLYWDAMANGRGHDTFRRELASYSAEAAERFGPMLDRWSELPGGVVDACAREGLHLNHHVFAHATGVIVHSPWCVGEAGRIFPGYDRRISVVPLGATVAPLAPERRAAVRARYGLPQDALVVGNFGIVHPSKMNAESLRAFAALAARDPSALFLMVGPEWDEGSSRAAVAGLGLTSRVRFLAPKPTSEFVDLVGVTDIGLNLRRPPTYGETSGTLLDLLRQGVPTIITAVGTFADFPDHAARKIPWVDDSSQDLLTATLLELAESRSAREAIRTSSMRYIRDRHDWSNVASMYAEVIERRITHKV